MAATTSTNENIKANGGSNNSHSLPEYASPMHVSASDPVTRTSLVFSIGDAVGDLDTVLGVFRKHSVSLKHIESRPSKVSSTQYDIFVDLPILEPQALVALVQDLKPVVKEIQIVSGTDEQQVPWFPRKISDLDICADRVTDFSGDLNEDHPGFKDPEYRKRREIITQKAKEYKYGQPLPRVEYTQTEIDTWRQVFTGLKKLHGTHACREHRHVFPLLEQNCGYRPDNIPQLEDVSNFLKDCTGFQLRPVTGLLSSRDFLNAFAFRTFTATQYIRHHSKPHYTPEPDVCHELLGHAPLFADPYFAEFAQEIGLASLGASDADIERLASLFWFSVEFGLCSETDKHGKSVVKAYGAGLLSSFGELEYSLSDKPERKPFDPSMASTTKYPVTEYQPVYFVASSFRDAAEKVRAFAATMDRPFTVRYNPYTQSVEIVDKKDQMLKVANEIKKEVQVLIDALSKV